MEQKKHMISGEDVRFKETPAAEVQVAVVQPFDFLRVCRQVHGEISRP